MSITDVVPYYKCPAPLQAICLTTCGCYIDLIDSYSEQYTQASVMH